MYLCNLPNGLDSVIERLILNQWIISPFDISQQDLYNPISYLVNSLDHGIRYYLIIDRNIFSFIISAYKKRNKKTQHRDAIGLIAFCHFSEIIVDVSMPVYEKINYN